MAYPKSMSKPFAVLASVLSRLSEMGSEPGTGAAPEDLAKSLRAASDKQGATLRAIGVKPQDLGG